MAARIRTLAAGVALAGGAIAQSTLYNLPGVAPGDGFGRVVRAAGDVDGDGRMDLLVASVAGNTGVGPIGYVQVVSGANGMPLWTLPGSSNSGQYGAALAACDVNGDGRPDVLVGEPFAGAGRVHVLDAAGGAPRTLLQGVASGDRFGAALAALGDVDGDGHEDFAVGAPDADVGFSSSGTVRVVSGLGGATLYSVHGSGGSWRLGASLAAIEDLDGDGVRELLAGAPGSTSQGTTHTGWARVYSGASGALLATLSGASAADAFGAAVASAGDVDGDGVCDLLIGAPQPSPTRSGYARVHSGATFALLRHLDGAAPGERFGSAVSAAGDVDGDGHDDIGAGAPMAAGGGAVRVFSGADGAMLLAIQATGSGDELGAALDGGFDLDDDGRPDLIAGAPGAGLSRVVSSGQPALTSDTHTLSAAGQGRQTLRLAAGSANAGRSYLVLGSASGTSGGIPFAGTTLALSMDRYLMHTRTRPGAPPLSGGAGFLDAQGEATVTFGPLSPATHAAFAGTTFHHAFVVLAPSGGVELASGPVPATLVP